MSLQSRRKGRTVPKRGWMPVTSTFHILRWTAAIQAKSGNRHPDRRRFPLFVNRSTIGLTACCSALSMLIAGPAVKPRTFVRGALVCRRPGMFPQEKPADPFRRNGRVERTHREDRKHFDSVRSFFSLADFDKQLAVHNRRSNNLPARPLACLSPSVFPVQFV